MSREPEDYSQKEVYAFFLGWPRVFGTGSLEKGFVNLVVTFKTVGLPITRDDFDVIFEAHDSRTLGQLLRAARERHIPIPDETDKLFATALEQRNYLNHDFFAEHAAHFLMTESGRRIMVQRLGDLIQLFKEADQLGEPIYNPLLERMGVSEDLLKKTAQELIKRAEHKNSD